MNPEPWPMPADKTENWDEERITKWTNFMLKVSQKYTDCGFYRLYLIILSHNGIAEDVANDNDFFKILDKNSIDELYEIHETEIMQECL